MIGIIDFNPDAGTLKDERTYIKLISELMPCDIEGVVFRDVSDLGRYDGLVLSGSRLSAWMYKTGVGSGDDYEHVDRVADMLRSYKGNVFGICFGSQLAALAAGGKVGNLRRNDVDAIELATLSMN